MPSILANDPNEIIEIEGQGSAPEKRNSGFELATQPFVFFCDDDIVLSKNCFSLMLTAIGDQFDIAYGDYLGVCIPPVTHPKGMVFLQKGREFNEWVLRQRNYISTMSLTRRAKFLGFDDTLPRFQDWDAWLRLIKAGSKGIYIPKVLFHAYYLDVGVTGSTTLEASLGLLKAKHADLVVPDDIRP